MGLFGRKKVSVTVHGNSSLYTGADGRYLKQARRNRKIAEGKVRNVVLAPHTTAELCRYIEGKYGVSKLEHTDERYKRAYVNVKAHLVFTYAPELITTPKREEPDHPPVSEHDPDYEAYQENEDKRWKEAVMVKSDSFRMRLHVYNISVMQGDLAVAWIEVYVEDEHNYLAFKTIDLEFENDYRTSLVIADIVKYFGASEEDRDQFNERFLQLVSVQ